MKRKKVFWAIALIIICIVSGLVYVNMQSGQVVETSSSGKG